MPPHFVHDLCRAFADHAGRPALVYRGTTYSYADLERLAFAAAARLQGLGMTPGDRVVVCTGAKLPFLIGHLGVLFGGGVSLPLNPRFTREELRHFLNDSGARLAIVGAEQQAIIESLVSETKGPLTVVPDQALLEGGDDARRAIDRGEDDPCLLLYSSGTTGWPKGIVHTNANLASSLHALGQCWRFTPEDRVVNVLPLFHIHGLSFATHLTWLKGACLLVEDAFEPVQTMQLIGRGTVFMSVPTIYYRLLEHPGFREAARVWKDVRLFTCGSAPIRPEVLPGLEEILGKPVINRYGMTEAHVLTSLPLDGPWPQGSVGLPLGGIEIRLVADSGPPVFPGEVGRVQARGPNLFREYWGQPEATRRAFVDGWFDTGDLGMQDAAAFLTLVGRSNELIITNGYNVYPQVVERIINECPGVRESAVLGVPDERRGERVAAVIVPSDPAFDEARLRAFLKDRLVDYQQPRTVVIAQELPRNAMGKVLRKDLRDKLSSS